MTATCPDGTTAPGARVSVVDAAGTMTTLIVANAAGEGKASLAPGTYTLSAALQGRLVGPEVTVTLTAGQPSTATLQLLQARTLNVSVKDPFGLGMPAKVTVLCVNGPCPFSGATYHRHLHLDAPAGGAAEIGYVPVTGQLALTLPPAEYEVVVSRGPEYSIWPDSTWPSSGYRVDLRTSNASVNAVLAQVVDTRGWVSADLHVHAVNSSDSAVGNAVRASNFLAEGVDVLLSTDHDVVTDFGPTVEALGATDFIATMVGDEATSFSHGHFNTFPLVRKDLPYGGAFDHAGGEDGPTLRLGQLFSGIKAANPGAVVQINHPRGGGGALTLLKVDTGTLASHGVPADYNMAAAGNATAGDSKLFSDGFDAIEAANGPSPNLTVLNDWMTFLSRGTVRTSTGVSDTHYAYSDTGGYARTYAKTGFDKPADFKPDAFAEAVRTQHVTVSNGPFIQMTARKRDSVGFPVGTQVFEIGDTVPINAAIGETVELTVDIQAPSWVQFDRVELYAHATGRESVNGESNSTWPDGRILDKHLINPAAWTLEAVPNLNGLLMQRVHLTERFVVKPTKDNWYVAMVRSSGGRSMWPLHGSLPAAWTNAILVDADGTGKYDDFPLKLSQGLSIPQPQKPLVAHVPTVEEFERAVRLLLNHTHQ